MPDFTVHPNLLEQMARLGDKPVASSAFYHPAPNLTVESAPGAKALYIADNLSGEFRFSVHRYQAEPVAATVIDLRGKLPVRVGATPYPKRPLAGVRLFVAHYTAGPPTSTVTDIARYQTGPGAQLPFPAIAYAYYTEQDGSTYQCHDLDRRLWGSDGVFEGQAVNDIAVHWCYAGDVAPTAAQIQGGRVARAHAETLLGRTLMVRGHRDDGATQCPGNKWNEWKGALL
jgi:hypothetical protein